MKFGFMGHPKRGFKNLMLESMSEGLKKHGHSLDYFEIEYLDAGIKECDVLVFVGCASASLKRLLKTIRAERRFVYIDKGYLRMPDSKHEKSKCLYYRASCNAPQPLHYLNEIDYGDDRYNKLNIEIKEMQSSYPDGRVVFAGSSQKYCNFYELGDATEYAKKIFERIRKHSKLQREIVYRPKPSWKEAVPIRGTVFSKGKVKLKEELESNGYILVTHGSNAAFEALIQGYPSLVLGNGIVKDLCISKIEEIDKPLYPSIKVREDLFKKIAYHQFTIDEFSNGYAWEHLIPRLGYYESDVEMESLLGGCQ